MPQNVEALALFESHEELLRVVENLLGCAELNQDDLEDDTRDTIADAEAVIARAKGDQPALFQITYGETLARTVDYIVASPLAVQLVKATSDHDSATEALTTLVRLAVKRALRMDGRIAR